MQQRFEAVRFVRAGDSSVPACRWQDPWFVLRLVAASLVSVAYRATSRSPKQGRRGSASACGEGCACRFGVPFRCTWKTWRRTFFACPLLIPPSLPLTEEGLAATQHMTNVCHHMTGWPLGAPSGEVLPVCRLGLGREDAVRFQMVCTWPMAEGRRGGVVHGTGAAAWFQRKSRVDGLARQSAEEPHHATMRFRACRNRRSYGRRE